MFVEAVLPHVPLISRLLVCSAVVLPALYLLASVLRNLYKPSLSSYPGPLLSRAFSLPHALRISSGRLPHRLHALHEQYGPVVRVGPRHLSYTDARAWRDIYGHRAGDLLHTQENPKCDIFYREAIVDRGKERSPPSIFDADREEHTRLRRAVAGGFSDRAIRAQEPIIQGYVNLLLQRLKQRAERGERVDIAQWLNWTTFDIIGDLVFAEPFGCLEGEQGHVFVHNVTGFVEQLGAFQSIMYLGLHKVRLFRWAVNAVVQRVTGDARGEMQRAMAEKLSRRLELKAERTDLFEGIMSKREEWNMSIGRLQNNATLIATAGSETTASLLAGAVFLLLQNPEALARLQAEVRSSFSSVADMTIAGVGRLPYLLACLNEALRRFPPAVSNFAREVHEGGEVIAGQFVPERTIVEVAPFVMHHSSLHWHDAFAFKPERWLKGETREDGEKSAGGDRPEVMQAFNVGPRNCVGKNLAYAEMRLILARLVYEFDWELAHESKDWMDRTKAFTIWKKDPLYIYLKPAQRHT